ncbi:GNAT family N-acetyltransferase [Tateyamaria pelophila]|uniref:GNAT family N-acetyltransferase n=1 Tax=Tateyamaria pelophila TaxID=328415 RepID=UPI001CBBE233|nr:GNAT family N-acetyltransferase [Tateyamaria pelophila]
MADLQIRAATAADMEDIARLCWAYRALLVDRSPHLPTFIGTYYAAETYDAMIRDLPRIHARPKGDIVVATLGDTVVGCAMYYPIDATTTEIKRVFVSPQARGSGAGQALISNAMARAHADGYKRMVLDSIAPLTEAIALYERMGFAPCAPFYDPDPDLLHALRFYDITL